VTARSASTPDQVAGSAPRNGVRATVTGVDSTGQLFRDSACVVLLKGQKCVYQSKYKPSPDNALLIEIREGGESWRCDAKIKSVSSAGQGRDGFRVTVELDRASSLVVESEDTREHAPGKEFPVEAKPASLSFPSATDAQTDLADEVPAADEEASAPNWEESSQATPPPDPIPTRQKPAAGESPRPASPAPLKPAAAPTPSAQAAVAELVRTLVTSAMEEWKGELQSAVAGQVEAAIRNPVKAIELKIEKELKNRPAISEESVRKIAAKAAEEVQIEWATASQRVAADAARAAVASDEEDRRRELRALVSGEIEAAWRNSLAARIDQAAAKAAEARIEEHSRTRSSPTESSVRQIATQIAESVQLEWASTKLQKIMVEAVRTNLATDSSRRRAEMYSQISSEIEAALRGPFVARVDAAIDKAVAARVEQFFQLPKTTETLKELIGDAIRRPMEAEYERRTQQVQAAVSHEVETAVRGPVATQIEQLRIKTAEELRAVLESENTKRRAEASAQISSEIEAALGDSLEARTNAALETTVVKQVDQYFRSPAGIAATQKMLADAVREPLEAEYELRARQVQTVVSRQIEATVRGPIASQMDEMLKQALEAQREEYRRTPQTLCEDDIQKIAAAIGRHPQLMSATEKLTADLSTRWAEIARTATAAAQRDIQARVGATERLAGEAIRDIQQKLNSLSSEMNRTLGGGQENMSAAVEATDAAGPEQDDRFSELLQATGSEFEREMKATLEKVFRKR
jgi:hypothetical protein